MKKEIYPILIYILLHFCICYACNNEQLNDIGKPVHNHYKIGLGTDTIYVKASMWGLTGEHIQIIFSPHSLEGKNFDSSVCFAYFEPTIYYKKIKDTLELYPTIKIEIPERFPSKFKIKQTVINKLEEIERYKESYKKYGLEKISVYE